MGAALSISQRLIVKRVRFPIFLKSGYLIMPTANLRHLISATRTAFSVFALTVCVKPQSPTPDIWTAASIGDVAAMQQNAAAGTGLIKIRLDLEPIRKARLLFAGLTKSAGG